jgi:hypothetical protein
MVHKTLHRKLKIEQHEPHKKGSELKCSGMVNSSCFISQELLQDKLLIEAIYI